MKKAWLIWILIGLFAIFAFGMALAAQKEEAKTEATKEAKAPEKAKAPVLKYMGAVKCKACHNLEKYGKQYDKWSKGPHAGSYATLANEASMKLAKKMKIKDPQKAGECLACHVTAYGVPDSLRSEKLTLEEGVSCEACHGPGEKYWTMKVMRDKKLALENGLIEPDDALCKTCHNDKSPTFIGFKYDEFVKKIDHSFPKKESK